MPSTAGLLRVNVVGVSGSGKSTFARRLARALAAPYVELDALFWDPNWGEPQDEVFFARVERALTGEAWVLDGNYHRTQPIKWARVQTVIWLDYSRPRTMFRSIKRSLWRALTRRELWPGTGNYETFAKLFSRDSIVLFAHRSYATHGARYNALFSAPPPGSPSFVRLRSPRQAEQFLRSIERRRIPY